MFEIYNLEKSFTSEYVKGRKKIANVTISLMHFKEKKNRLEDFEFNVKHCLRNEITSKSIVIHEHEFGVDTINDKVNCSIWHVRRLFSNIIWKTTI